MPEDVEQCVKALRGKKGIDNPYAICNWMKAQGKSMPSSENPVEDEVAKKYQAEMLEEERRAMEKPKVAEQHVVPKPEMAQVQAGKRTIFWSASIDHVKAKE